MTVKRILAYFDGRDSRPAEAGKRSKLDAAVALACRHGARLDGLFAIPMEPLPAYVAAQIPEEIWRRHDLEIERSAAAAEKRFRAALDAVDGDGEWHFVRDRAEPQIIDRARFADLIVVSLAEDSGWLSAAETAVYRVLSGCGRPVLLMPAGGFPETLGRRLLLGWDGSFQAARAARAALPLLRQAVKVEVVEVVAVQTEDDLPYATAAACRYLSRHGVNAEGAQIDGGNHSYGEALLARALATGCDLIVTGAYGHSRTFETVIGGVTQQLLRASSLPLLMTH